MRNGEMKEFDDDFGGKKGGFLLRVLLRGVAKQSVHIAEERGVIVAFALSKIPIFGVARYKKGGIATPRRFSGAGFAASTRISPIAITASE